MNDHDKNQTNLPASPETQTAETRKELDQNLITHEGKPIAPTRDKDNPQGYMGAQEENVTPIAPPMVGASDVTAPAEDEENINPRTELTPG